MRARTSSALPTAVGVTDDGQVRRLSPELISGGYEPVHAFATVGASIAVLGLAFQLACHVTHRRLGAAIVAHLVVNGAAVLALAFA